MYYKWVGITCLAVALPAVAQTNSHKVSTVPKPARAMHSHASSHADVHMVDQSKALDQQLTRIERQAAMAQASSNRTARAKVSAAATGKSVLPQKNPPINFQNKVPKASLHSSGTSRSGGKMGQLGGSHGLRMR